MQEPEPTSTHLDFVFSWSLFSSDLWCSLKCKMLVYKFFQTISVKATLQHFSIYVEFEREDEINDITKESTVSQSVAPDPSHTSEGICVWETGNKDENEVMCRPAQTVTHTGDNQSPFKSKSDVATVRLCVCLCSCRWAAEDTWPRWRSREKTSALISKCGLETARLRPCSSESRRKPREIS